MIKKEVIKLFFIHNAFLLRILSQLRLVKIIITGNVIFIFINMFYKK